MDTKYIEYEELGIVKCKTEDLNIENLASMEVVIKNESSIISAGTELARLYGLDKGMSFPFRPGYGCIGRIIAKGEGVTDFAIGDRVFFAGKHASVQRFKHGSSHQWEYLFPVPEDIDPMEASIACMINIAMSAPNVTDIRLNDTVAVFGLGMVGILSALIYKLRGAKVIAVDPVKERCDLARELGLDLIVDCPADKQLEAIHTLTNGKGVKVAVDAVGHSAVVCNCIKAAADFGQVLLLGSPRSSVVSDITEVLWDIHEKGLSVKGAHMFNCPVNEQRGGSFDVSWIFATAFDLIKNKKIEASKLISHIIKPEQADEAYKGLENNKTEYTCVVFDWRD